MKKKQDESRVLLAVQAPMRTRDILMALRDWEPQEGLKYTLVRRRGTMLVFEVSTPSGYQARGLALKRLAEKHLADTPYMSVSVM